MLPLRYARKWQIASLLLLAFVLAAALMPAVWFWDDRVKAVSMFRGIDKWLHGVTFLVLSVWFSGMVHARAYWRVGVGLLIFGLLIELCQRAVNYRSAEWLDVGADAAGIILGLAIAVAGAGGWCRRAEERFARG